MPNDEGATTIEEYKRSTYDADYDRMLNLLGEKDTKTAEFITTEDGEMDVVFYTENTEALLYALTNCFLAEEATIVEVANKVAFGLPVDVQQATANKIETYDYKFRAGLTGAYLVRAN